MASVALLVLAGGFGVAVAESGNSLYGWLAALSLLGIVYINAFVPEVVRCL